jgi:hypothetical protein
LPLPPYDAAVVERQGTDRHEIAFEAYGVRAALTANRAELAERLRGLVPPGWQPCPMSEVDRSFGLTVEESGTCTVSIDEIEMGHSLELDLALMLLDSQLRLYLGTKAPDTVFVHAGAVTHNGTAIVMPGQSFAGKTTLVAAMVRAGATYYSDEFAVIDERGDVRPYAKSLTVRGDDGSQNHTVESLGWTAGSEPVPVGAIVVTSYRPGAEWRPRRLSAGEAAMALLAHAVPARERPAEVMRALSRAGADAIAIESERGEADELAPLLLAELERLTV